MVARISNPTSDAVDKCIEANIPAVLTGLTSTWKATTQWDIEYLRRKVGKTTAQVVTAPSEKVHWDPKKGLPQKAMSFDAFADRLSDEARCGERSYLQEDMSLFPSLAEDYTLPSLISDKPIKRAKFWVSGSKMSTSLHYDAVETFHWLVRGTKHFICFAPGLTNFYPNAWFTTAPFISQVDAESPNYREFPKFKRATPIEFELRAGEILYLPAFWWHQVRSMDELNISVNFVWFAKPSKNLRNLPQFARCGRHLVARLKDVRKKAEKSRAVSSAPQAY